MNLRNAPQDTQSPTPAVGPEPAAGVARPFGHDGVPRSVPGAVLGRAHQGRTASGAVDEASRGGSSVGHALPGTGTGPSTSDLVQVPDGGTGAAWLLVPASPVVPLRGTPPSLPPERSSRALRTRRSINASTRSSHR